MKSKRRKRPGRRKRNRYLDWCTEMPLYVPDPLRDPQAPGIDPEHLKRLTPEQRRFLERRVPLDCPDMHLISREELPTYFARAGGLNIAKIILTDVAQYVIRFLNDKDEPIRGNIRSYYYRRLNSTLERLGLLGNRGGLRVQRIHRGSRPFVKKMEKAFEALFKTGFFHYRDLDIYNQRERFQKRGRINKRHLLYTEKEGLFWFCEAMHGEHSLHVYASRGSASWLDIDYIAKMIRDLDVRNIYVASLTDHDPWGVFIALQIQKKLQLKVLGFRRIYLTPLTNLDLFDPEIIQQKKRNLLQGHEDPKDTVHKVIMRWVQGGGGIDGEPYGIHIDHANWEKVAARVKDWIDGKYRAPLIDLCLSEDEERELKRYFRAEGAE